ncbi:MAG: bile acid:sodium symporter family protein [Gammaproteobacteria bacterium]|nr:MAG: bile acid:sodium symporter family protein [Gammaproteobacteria bacterium]
MHYTVTLFPLWALAISALALARPEYFSPYKDAIVPLLMIIMLSIGMTLTIKDFTRAIKRPKVIGFGVLLQYLVMPFVAFAVSRLLSLPTELMIGMILVGAVPGGTASNIVSFLARGDVALSITLTALSTLIAVIATPWLVWLYVGQDIPVPVLNMLFTVLKIVVLPVLVGVSVNALLKQYIHPLQPYLPAVSVIAILLAIAIIVALNSERIAQVSGIILLAVALHNAIGLTLGYWLTRLSGQDVKTSRTIAIEVGMQNSGLAVALAIKHFAVLTALPGALFSVWHNLTGSVLAAYWSNKD